MATLKDVAKDAGVSIATVSCCLSGSKPVKSETKAKIMDSIEKLKYIPNQAARNLKAFSSNLIGVVLININNHYHAEIFKGISAYLQNHDYTVSVAFSNNSPDIECEKIEEFISQNAAGLIIITCQPQNTDFFRSRILNYQVPVVFIEHNPENLFVNFVGFDNYQTSYYLTSSLIQKEYRDIALLCGSPLFSSECSSIDGYKDALTSNGLPVNADFICPTNMSKEDAFKSVLTKLCGQRPDAVITTSENIALGTIEAFNTYGIKVPENIQVITYGEESWNKASRFHGVLHTQRTAFHLGVRASELLVQNILSPVLFEPKVLIFPDSATEEPLPLRNKSQLSAPSIYQAVHDKKIRVLMVDLFTSRSVQLLSDYFTRKTGIDIEFDFCPQDELLQRISQTIDSTEFAYDVHMYDIPWLNYMVQNTFVSNISDFVNSKNFKKDQIFKENMDNCRYEGEYYGVPLIGGSQILFYRKDLFENRDIISAFRSKYKISLRPPKTWTEFNGTAAFFTSSFNPDSPTLFGTSLAGNTDEELAPEILIRLWAYGGKIWDNYNRPCLDSVENLKAFESILSTFNYIDTNPLETSINQTVHDFSSGKTAMLITYSEYAAQISQNNIAGRVGYELLPGRCPASVGWNVGLNPFSKKSDLVFQYFEWLSMHDTNFYMTILDGQSPVIAPYHSQELLNLYPWLAITERSFSHAHKRTGPYKNNTLIIPQNKIEKILCNVLRQILCEGLDIPEALRLNQEKMKKLFHSYGYPKPICK